MHPLIGSSLITGGSGLLGGIFGYFGQRASNKAMLQATRETNAQNYKIWQEQQAHNVDMFDMQNQANIDMWNMNNEYNDPMAQRQRLEDAGYNPMMLQGTANISGSSSAPQSAQATPAQAPQMQAPPPQAFTSPAVVGLQASLESLEKMSQMLYSNAQTNQTELESEKMPYALQALKLNVDDMQMSNDMKKWYKNTSYWQDNAYNEYRLNKYKADIAFNDSWFSTTTLSTRQNMEEAKLANMNGILALTMCDFQTKTTLNKYFEAHQQQDLALKIGQVALQIKQGKLTDAQIKKVIAEIADTYSNIAYRNSMTALNWQQYNFNNVMNPLLLEGQKIHNEGGNISNSLGIQSFLFNDENNEYILGTNKYGAKSSKLDFYDKGLNLIFRTAIVPSMIKAAIGENEYKVSLYGNEKEFQNYIKVKGWNTGNSSNLLDMPQFIRWRDKKYFTP